MAVESKIIEHVKSILKFFDNKYLTKDGNLKKQNVIDDLNSFDKNLMTKLFSDKLIYNSYVEKVNGVDVFKLNQFLKMFEYKEFWEDSYTKYSNKIGLSADNKFIDESADVVLNFPYKDAVLKAGMTKEEAKNQKEPFFNEIMAKPEIDELLEPKIFKNIKLFDSSGTKKVNKINNDDNLIIKGNNLIALSSLTKRYTNKIQLAYIDVPFNTDKDFPYNDKFTKSSWLTFMLNRLKLLKKMLKETGSIFVHVDWHESAYTKLLLDSVFGEDNFINEIIWHYSSGGEYKNEFAKKHDTIYWYSKSSNYDFFPENKEVGQKRGPMKRNNMKKNVDNDGRVYYSIKSSGKIYKYYEDDIVTPDDVWNVSIMHQRDPERVNFKTQKPERLIARIIGAVTQPNDIVLDCFMGTGTTQATAMKMHRHFIGVEQMDYIDSISIPRLQRVISGEQVGISKEVNWNGGGSFIYAELMKKNRGFLDDLLNATTIKELNSVYNKMKEIDDLDFRVDLSKYEKECVNLKFEDRQKLLIKMLDKNQLYYNYNNIDDNDVKDLLTLDDYKFNKSFYEYYNNK